MISSSRHVISSSHQVICSTHHVISISHHVTLSCHVISRRCPWAMSTIVDTGTISDQSDHIQARFRCESVSDPIKPLNNLKVALLRPILKKNFIFIIALFRYFSFSVNRAFFAARMFASFRRTEKCGHPASDLHPSGDQTVRD